MITNINAVELCKWCNEDCSNNMKFSERPMKRFGLEMPMHLECAIIAIIEKKIDEKISM